MTAAVVVVPKGSEQQPLLNDAAESPSFAEDIKGADATDHSNAANDQREVLRRAILTTMPVFMGYAGMIILQGNIKSQLGISNNHPGERGYVFGVGVSMLYLGNLIFRLMHNFIFSMLRPKHRVMVSYSCLAVAHALLAVMFYMVRTQSLAWVFISYLLAGVGIGSFESNIISVLTPLGHATKMWAVLGIGIGFNSISIGSFLLFAFIPGSNTGLEMAVYLFISACNVAGLVFYIVAIPKVDFEASYDTWRVFIHDLRQWRCWLPKMWQNALALLVDMFFVSLFSSLVLYVYDETPLPLWPYAEPTMPKDVFLALYNLAAFVGDFVGRRVAYYDKYRTPFLFLIFAFIGGGLVLSKTVLVALIGILLIMFCNGSIYAQTTKHVDNVVPKKYNLMALSIWLFVGDFGSFTAAQCVSGLRALLGDIPLHHVASLVVNATTTMAPH